MNISALPGPLALWRSTLCAALLVASSARAAGDDLAAISAFMQDPDRQQQIARSAAKSQVLALSPCADANFTLDKTFAVYQALSVDSSGTIVAGAWRQRVQEQGCGESHVLNVLVIAHADGKLAFIPVLPGDSHADPILQRDALKYAGFASAAALAAVDRNCTDSYVVDTQYVGEQGQALAGGKGAPWKELWTIRACTRKAIVPMNFTPDATGTTISTGTGPAVKVVPL